MKNSKKTTVQSVNSIKKPHNQATSVTTQAMEPSQKKYPPETEAENNGGNLVKSLYLIVLLGIFGFSSFYHYYFVGNESVVGSHSVGFADGGYIAWIALSSVPMLVWLFFKDFFGANNRKISLPALGGNFLWILFVTALATVVEGGRGLSEGVLFWLRVLLYIIPISLLGVALYGFGSRLLDIKKTIDFIPEELRAMCKLIVGWGSFVLLLNCIGFFGLYNLWIISFILLGICIFSYRSIGTEVQSIVQTRFETGGFVLENSEKGMNLASIQVQKQEKNKTQWTIISLFHGIFFVIFSLVVSVNLVNIYRPFPIGWDDLGAYMNFPKLIAISHSTLEQGLVFWQAFTGIGFLFESATLAFYINAFGSLLAFVAIWGGVRYFMRYFESEKVEWLVSFPLIGITLFASLPMIVFQQAKDMKLDSGLLSVTIVSIALLFASFKTTYSRQRNVLLLIAGGLAGVAFAIKLTSLMLIIASLGAIWHFRGRVFGYFSFFLIFIGVFTAGKLWSFMNVVYPKDETRSLLIFSAIAIGLGALLLGIQYWRSIKKITSDASSEVLLEKTSTEEIPTKANIDWIKGILLDSCVYIFGFILLFTPWLTKNLYEISQSGKSPTVFAILNGVPRLYEPDYSKIHTPEELSNIQKNLENRDIGNNGQIANEDFGRYFGYENGINNYLKLPYNLSMQVNQSGEFTDISYIFLALVPITVFLFLGTRLGYLLNSIYLLGLYGIFFIRSGPIKEQLTNFFGTLTLPMGYLLIVPIAMLPLGIMILDARIRRKEQKNAITADKSATEETKEDENTPEFPLFFGFVTLYTLIFLVSAFGIVWYGILMYFCFIVLISLAFGQIFKKVTNIRSGAGIHQTNNLEGGITNIIFPGGTVQKQIVAIILFLVSMPYFGYTVVARAWNNLPSPQDSLEYKLGTYSEFESIFLNRPEYSSLLSEINLKDSKLLDSRIRNEAKTPVILELFKKYPEANLSRTLSVIDYAESLAKTQNTPEARQLLQEAKKLKELGYKGILYPDTENTNTADIYRVGTFLTYYVSDNRKRFMEDSLIFNFEPYFKGKTREDTAKNLRKMGIKYMLLDLNAATIDKDPRRDLTRRYEQVLDFIRSDKVRLIATDSLCLQLGLELKNDPNYLLVAGANYHSYKKDENGKETAISSSDKTLMCLRNIAQVISEKRVSEKSFPYLLNYASYLEKNNITNKEEMMKALYPYVQRSWMASFEILD